MGLESGVVEEFSLARDYNRLDSTRVYHAHDKVGPLFSSFQAFFELRMNILSRNPNGVLKKELIYDD